MVVVRVNRKINIALYTQLCVAVVIILYHVYRPTPHIWVNRAINKALHRQLFVVVVTYTTHMCEQKTEIISFVQIIKEQLRITQTGNIF